MTTTSFEQFADRYDISMRADMTGLHKDAEGWEFHAWAVKLTRAGKTLEIPFRMGTGHEGRAPDIETVLASLALDAQSIDNADDFEDWAEDLGYDTDSRKAESSYRECCDMAERLKEWLGASLYAELLECDEFGDDPEPEDLHRRFDEEILPLVQEQYEQDGVADIPARCEAFNDWLDGLHRDGEISDWLANNTTHPESCER